jgi:tRNA threonylcarbamoyladenosine biosynthesis protein TsaE
LSGIQSDFHDEPIVGTPSAPAGGPTPKDRWQGLWQQEADTQAFALRLARSPAIAQATLGLHGDLGAGKTTFVRHLLRALGVQGRIKSPTYAVVEPHSAIDPAGQALSIWHFDFYRFNDPREWEDAGFRELFAAPGLKLVEWPERAADLVPAIDLHIHIEPEDPPASAHMADESDDDPSDTVRSVRATALTPTGRALLKALE